MKPPVKFGIIAALIVIAMNLAIYYSGNLFTPVGIWSRVISLAVILPFIIMSISARRAQLGGQLGYRESLKAGMGTALIIATMMAIFNYLFFKLELTGAFMKEAQRQAIVNKMDRDQAYEMIQAVYWTYSPGSQATYSLMWTLITCFVMTFAASTFMVRRKAV